MTSHTFMKCPIESGPTPDFIIFIVSGWGLDLERGVLLSKCGSKGWSRLHITCLYSVAELYTRFLYRWHTQRNTHKQVKIQTSVCRPWLQIILQWQLSIKWRCSESKSTSYGWVLFKQPLQACQVSTRTERTEGNSLTTAPRRQWKMSNINSHDVLVVQWKLTEFL